MKDENTIFGVKNEERVYLGKEVRKEKLKIQEGAEERKLWGNETEVYCVCNGERGDYQFLKDYARSEAAGMGARRGEVDFDYVKEAIADLIHASRKGRLDRKYLNEQLNMKGPEKFFPEKFNQPELPDSFAGPLEVSIILGGKDVEGKHLCLIDESGGMYEGGEIYTSGDKEGEVRGWLESKLNSRKGLKGRDFEGLSDILEGFDWKRDLIEINQFSQRK